MLLSKIIQLTTDIKSHKSSLNQAANQKDQYNKEFLRIKNNLDKEIIELKRFLPPK
ncbi:hypothetical protein R4Z10_21150 (plasmid) [Niallia sp. XMNu-256]|uniref:hypothetical protein n=1 Tax=Niallia sp. XMNu-256 TaxID=3082444 RepID=UPI0030D56579